MPNGQLQIGNGIGEAADWNSAPAAQALINTFQQQQAQQQAKQQALVSQLASLNPTGIRDADKPDYQNKYNDWKQSVINANNLPKNSPQRLQSLADAQNKYDDINDFIGQSKKEALNEHAIGNQWINNPHLFSDDSHAKLMKSLQSPMSSSSFIPGSQYQNLGRYVDDSKVDDAFDTANQTALKQTAYGNPIQSVGHDTQGNKTGVIVHNEREIAPADLLTNAAHMYTVSPDIKASIDKRYANINGDTPQQTMMLRLKQNALDRGDLTQDSDGNLSSEVNESTKPEFKANTQPDKFYAHFNYAQNNGNSNQLTPTQYLIAGNPKQNVNGMLQGSSEAMNRFIKLHPAGQYGDKEPTATIDPATDEHVYSFPDQVTPDKKQIAKNATIINDYNANPEYNRQGGFLGMGGTKTNIPYQQSDQYKKDVASGDYKDNPVIVKKPAQVYKLDPHNPQSYISQAQAMAKDQNINTTQYNQILAKKGGHGVIVPQTPTKNIGYTVNGTQYNIPAEQEKDFLKSFPNAKKL